mmetsp:Transcript_6835/g.17209  ORF Transcript_6835/g.17209 Transcript_6835/m.17209 type:complete len:207 (-) Transcript_6835:542-1162(-)
MESKLCARPPCFFFVFFNLSPVLPTVKPRCEGPLSFCNKTFAVSVNWLCISAISRKSLTYRRRARKNSLWVYTVMNTRTNSTSLTAVSTALARQESVRVTATLGRSFLGLYTASTIVSARRWSPSQEVELMMSFCFLSPEMRELRLWVGDRECFLRLGLMGGDLDADRAESRVPISNRPGTDACRFGCDLEVKLVFLPSFSLLIKD